MEPQKIEIATLPNLQLNELVLPFPQREIRLLTLRDPFDAMHVKDANSSGEIYWAELWPSSLALAGAILDGSLALPDGEALELGCGAGLVSVAAAVAGKTHRVRATDYEPRALKLAAENAARNGVAERISFQPLDWRKPYSQKHKLVLAADCLYEKDSPFQIVSFLKQTLDLEDRSSRAYLGDPQRWTARNFSLVARDAGFNVERTQYPALFVSRYAPIYTSPMPSEAQPVIIDIYTVSPA